MEDKVSYFNYDRYSWEHISSLLNGAVPRNILSSKTHQRFPDSYATHHMYV